MTPTGIVAIVLGIVIVVLSAALLIIWFRGNKKSRVLTDDRKRFEDAASGLQRQLKELEKNLASAKNRGERCAESTKQQDEIIRNLENTLQELRQRHKERISDYEYALKHKNDSLNSELQAANDQLRRENKDLSEANSQLTKEKEELSKEMENTIIVNEYGSSKYNDLIDVLNGVYNTGGDYISKRAACKYIHKNPGIFLDSIESGVLTKWIKDNTKGSSSLLLIPGIRALIDIFHTINME